MNHTDSYYNYLLECAKSGSIESFVELCELLHQDVFCTAFQLVDDYDLAFDITKKTFTSVWNNVDRYEGKKDCNYWIRELTIILCFFQIKEKQEQKTARAITYAHMAKVEENPVEEAYASLNFYQKIAVILATKLKFSLYDMRNVFEDLSEVDVRDMYRDAVFKLTKSSHRTALNKLSHEEIQFMVNAEERGDIKLSGFDGSILYSIDKFKDELDNIFTGIKPDPSLLEEVKEQFVVEKDKEETDAAASAFKEKKQKSSKYDKAIKSAIDEFFIKQKLFLSTKNIKKYSVAGHLNSSLIGVSLLLLSIIVVYYSIEMGKSNTPWQVETQAGYHKITGEDYLDVLYENDIIKTESGSDVSIKINEFGILNVKGKSELRLYNGQASDNVIYFNGDSLEFSSEQKPFMLKELEEDHTLTIELEMCTLNSIATDFTILNSIRFYELYVNNGWVDIQYNKKKLVVGKGYWKDLKNDISIPIFRETSDIVKDVANDPSLLSLKMERMLPELEKYDLLTIWHLMNLAPKNERNLIIDKIEEMLPILDKSTILGLRKLNEKDLASLLDLIKWMLIEEVF
jgi:DNA-directed RNA polymerase specialized sigma24 family protein